jgi:3-(3-hydroxy-phenyl)propionate hydroxylase
MSSQTEDTYDVAIVGFGPSGAIAAGLLGQAGLRTFVCDASEEVYDKPRAIALDHEILRVFQYLGIADAVEPWMEPFTPSEYFGVDGQLIKRFGTLEPPFPQAFPPSVVFTQPAVERILRQTVTSLPSVDVALGWRLESLEQTGEAVTLHLVHRHGKVRSVAARYLIGCDGAGSTVRASIGSSLEDLAFDEPWLVADVLVNERGRARLPATSVQYCEPERPCTMVIGPGNHRRWEISLKPGEDPKETETVEGTWKLLSRWLTPDDGTLWRQASYRFHALVAERWRSGRVFLAGDAAHQQPPFLGQGLCQGVRDVANLTWKLIAVLEGRGTDRLLDTYGEERKRHVRELTSRIKAIGAVICERDTAKARQRDAALLEACGGIVVSVPRQNVLPPLDAGLIDVTQHSANGTLFPQPWLEQGAKRRRLDDVAGLGWRLLLDGAGTGLGLPDTLARKLKASTIVIGAGGFVETDGIVGRWFAQHACRAALVRPDNYVYGVASSAADIARMADGLAPYLPGPGQE